ITRKLAEFEGVRNEIERLRSKKQELIARMEMVKDQIGELERQKREMEDRFNKSSEVIRVMGQEDAVSKRLNELLNKKSQLEYELASLGIPTSTLNRIKEKEKEIEELEAQSEQLQKEYITRLSRAREEFTKIANYLMKELEFNLEAEITPDFSLVVRRNGTLMDLRKLSSSERTSLALVLVITAIKAYFKTPFFIVDESFMTFDQKRFQKLVDYLKDLTDYIIITRSDENVALVKQDREESQVTPA
ncbi:MAG: hypothetical protein QW264_07610, partial [Metallosphaera sp.]